MFKRALITGGLGFIGSSLAIRLAQQGVDVTVVDAMLPDYGGNFFNIAPVRDRVSVNLCDVRDEQVLAHLVRGQDIVFHLAAQVSHVMSLSNPYPDIDINVRGMVSVLEACRKANPGAIVVRAGTRGEYGSQTKLPVSEDAPSDPAGIHEISQLSAEMIARVYHRVHGMTVMPLRLTNVYGPRSQMKHSHYGVVNWFVRQALDGKPIPIFGEGKLLRDFLYIDDCVDALLAVASTPAASGKILNVGVDAPSTFRDVAEILAELVPGTRIEFTEFTPERKHQEVGDYYSDITKIRGLCGWAPRTSLHEGLRRTVDYYRRHCGEYWKP
jgi:UDP-glucose 4-epimerase